MDKLVSIIIPVYKVEDYLSACIDSVLAQTYSNIEIILVDDGSPDDCGKICDRYATAYPQIIALHKTNGGLSDARNAGMQVAKGDYLMFVDSDDLLPPNAVQILLNLALSEDAELVIGAHDRFEEIVAPPTTAASAHLLLSSTEAMVDMFRNGCSAWARLYRREIHDGISYPVGIINEDEAIVLQILERCHRVVKTEKNVYHYRCRPESITTTSFSLKKLAWKEHCAANLRYVREHHPEVVPDAAARYRSGLLWSLTEIALSNGDYKKESRLLQKELRKERKTFRSIPFQYPQDKFRMILLMYFPFWMYRAIIRRKRGNWS